jgi:hypothetical protein
VESNDIESILRGIDILADQAVELRRERDRLKMEKLVMSLEMQRLQARLSHYESNEIERRLADGTG